MTLVETGQISLLIVGICFCLIAALTNVFKNFVALKANPKVRATWTVAPAYAIVVIAFLFSAPAQVQLFAPLAALPGAGLAFWFWLRDFRAGWIDEAAGLPDGVKLANDDWRRGLLIVIGLCIAAAVKVFLSKS